jgi:hypothetical protein
MKTVKFTKTAAKLMAKKKVGDIILSFRGNGLHTKREQSAILFLRDHGLIKFVRQYSGDFVERHYEVVKCVDC